MREVTEKTFDEERALYGSDDLVVNRCRFEGPADGESALKESKNIKAEDCYFDLRYPFWHNSRVIIENSEMTTKCRAPLWYSSEIIIYNCKIHGVKAVRECNRIKIKDCDIISPEFGWNNRDFVIEDATASGEYFLMNTVNIKISRFNLDGKYSFQYVDNMLLTDSTLNTKDAFWHAKNSVIRKCKISGEYLGWYSENVTFEDCTIIGTQPFCYCKGLKLINCEMIECDRAFERSDVEATLTSHVISIKNPYSGHITVPSVEEIILDDENAKCVIEKKGTI